MPGAAFITGRMPSLSLRYVCVRRAICRRLLRSFVTFARSRTLLKAGTAIAARIMMVAITTSNSIRAKARENFLFIGGISLGKRHDIRFEAGGRAEKRRKRKIALESVFLFL